MVWIVAFVLILAALLAGIVYLWTRFRRFGFVKLLAKDKKWLSRLLGLVPFAVIILFACRDAVNTVIVVLHLALFWLILDGIAALTRRIRKRKEEIKELEPGKEHETQKGFRPYWIGMGALLLTALYLFCGWVLAHRVVDTRYSLVTEKNLGQESLRIVQISDSHLGATFGGKKFAEYMEHVNTLSPDLVVVTGDFVDDGTKRDSLIIACEALGKLETTYGIYFVFGNHDKGYFDYRDFSAADLVAELEKNGVVVLEDEVVPLNDHIDLAGRQDASEPGRATAENVLKRADPQKYIILLDHQPNDYDAEEKTGADLVLSGHTHGGQMLPITYIGEWLGINDSTYGKKVRNSTTFIVNSGISDWAVKFKTGTISEIGIIDITMQ